MARNLNQKDLGGMIFGCSFKTMTECISKKLFGLPSSYFLYVRNIKPGMPLFLFNYSDRMMHGIYEAVTSGQFNIDPYAWTNDGSERTAFPAQVRIRVRTKCEALSEDQFKKAIQDNYYTDNRFYFELDHVQTKTLESLFRPLSIHASIKQLPAKSWKVKSLTQSLNEKLKETSNRENVDTVPVKTKPTKSYAESSSMNELELDDWYALNEKLNTDGLSMSASDHGNAKEPAKELSHQTGFIVGHNGVVGTNLHNRAGTLGQPSSSEVSDKEMDRISQKLEELYMEHLSSAMLSKDSEDVRMIPGMHDDLCKEPLVVGESFVQGNGKLIQVIKTLTHTTTILEKKQAESDKELQKLRNEVKDSGSTIEQLSKKLEQLESQLTCLSVDDGTPIFESPKLIYLVGGYDGSRWLSELDSFSPSEDKLIHLKPMSYPRTYASAAALNDNIFVIGGGDSVNTSWSSTVECYNQSNNNWVLCPSLNHAKGNCGAATLDNKIYAVGGGNGIGSLTDVEMFDPILGKWINCHSLIQRRLSHASVPLDGALYTVGGYDGSFYLLSAERYDPREGYWTRIPSMNIRRGCHTLALLDNKIYAMGGYNGDQMISSVEVFDPRSSSWMLTEPMNLPKGHAATVVVDNTLFVIGGLNKEETWDIVETYKEGAGWSICPFKAMKKRCSLSAVVL